MPTPDSKSPIEGPQRMQAAMARLFDEPSRSDAALHAKLDRIITLLEAQPQSTAILTGNAVREAMDELMRRNR